jgi:ribosomal protein S18 acetylase RimI-like enzyme
VKGKGEHGAIVGFCSVGKCRDKDGDETYGELYALYVEPHSMKQGVGSALAETGQDFLMAQGFTDSTLWVLAANARARRFYASQGWVADGVTRTEEIGNAQISEVRYTMRFLSKQQSQSQI